MNILSIFCFIGCAIVIALSYRKSADALSPARVYTFIWLLVLGLTNLKLSRLQYDWSLESWIVVLLGPCAFLTGLFMTYVLNLQTSLRPLRVIRENWRRQPVRDVRLFWTVTTLFLLFAGSYFVIRYIKGIIPPLFSFQPGKARIEFTMFGIGLFLHNVVLIVYFTIIYHLHVRGNRKKKFLLAVMAVASALLYFFLLQRFQLILTGIMCIVIVYYATHHLRTMTMTAYMGGTALFFYWVSTLRSGIQLFVNYLHQNSKMKFSSAYAMFTEPYMYFAMNLENFARGADKLDHHTYGYYTFDYVLALTGLKHWIGQYFTLDETPYLISGYNTYTGYWMYLRDFGLIGLAVIPLLLGIAFGTIYYSMRRDPTIQNVTLYGLCVFLILFSFFNNPLAYLWFMYTVFVFIIILRFIRVEVRP